MSQSAGAGRPVLSSAAAGAWGGAIAIAVTAWPRVMLVTDGRGRGADGIAAVAAALGARGLAVLVQLREKQLPAGELFQCARRLQALLRRHSSGAMLAVNGRFDVALAAGADAVHLPADGVPAARVRAVVGARLRIGVSTHAPAEVAAAAAQGADYVVFGPVFETPSKRALGRPHGLSGLRQASALAPPHGVRLFAIGGVDATNAAECVRAGAHGVAMMRALLQDPPAAVAAALAEALLPFGGGDR